MLCYAKVSNCQIVVGKHCVFLSSTQKLCLQNIVKLYLKVRTFSYTRDFITKYPINERQSKKEVLRKEMKEGDIYKT